MEVSVFSEEKMSSKCGFSISVGNIIESSTTNSSSSSSSSSSSPPPQFVVKIENPGVFKKKRRRGRKAVNDKTQMVKTTYLTDDGYGWRKYGQKNILNEPHPKSYYRCTHHDDENCRAKKWIQQESEDPPIYKTTYLGHHTCKNPHRIPQIFIDPSSSMTSSSPALIRFDSPTASHAFNINGDHQKMMKTCKTESNKSLSPPSCSNVSMMFLDDQADFEIGTIPLIASPDCSFGSYDLDTMIQELIVDANDDFSPDYW